ncbi:Chromosome segregation protein mal2 [Neolecta irregularis DAH-3]|uniref:Chromosome segregation protein mal2 n=1 Tax=Neolecta irregularis (strain DAH-3) TaxID=1198029 RepID=A0A1U7LKQ7_NEOID|nr:Chromosome segregation protein mal2 [Neolecta irregularis DAH-3]|eukprot:OLL23240.1 Chromosome segregation protein mal2 [Neolecta irregularis DAH-3]
MIAGGFFFVDGGYHSPPMDSRTAALQAQVAALKHRRIRAAIAASRRPLVCATIDGMGINLENIHPENIGALDIHAQKKHVESSIRRMAGLTLFQPHDPNPNPRSLKPSTGQCLMGLRIDLCLESRFQSPYYLILAVDKRAFRIYKHTIPSFIPLSSLARSLLNSDFSAFARALRSALLLWTRRNCDLSLLSRLPAVSDLKFDHSLSLVDLTFRNSQIHLVYSSSGTPDKCIVLTDHKRDPLLEHQIFSHKGSLSDFFNSIP